MIPAADFTLELPAATYASHVHSSGISATVNAIISACEGLCLYHQLVAPSAAQIRDPCLSV